MTEELKQKANDYAEKHAFRVPYDGSNKFYDDVDFKASKEGYLAGAEPREKRIEELEGLLINSKRLSDTIEKAQKKQIAELEAQIEQLQRINNEQKETLKKVRVALIQERTANIMNYGKGGVEMFDSMFEILKGVSN